MIQPGDTVFVDDPCYFNLLANLRAHRAQVIGIPFHRTGPDLDTFAALAAQHRPVLYITNSALHNPTGSTLTPAVAHRLLKIAETFDIAILEDDIYADFEEQPAPRLAALDQLNRVIYTGSFSKTLSAASRCGWIAARQDWIEGLTDLRMATISVQQRGFRPIPASAAHRRQLPQACGIAARTVAGGVGAGSQPVGGVRHVTVDGAARRYVPVGDATGGEQLGRHRPARCRQRHRHGARQRFQRIAFSLTLHAI